MTMFEKTGGLSATTFANVLKRWKNSLGELGYAYWSPEFWSSCSIDFGMGTEHCKTRLLPDGKAFELLRVAIDAAAAAGSGGDGPDHSASTVTLLLQMFELECPFDGFAWTFFEETDEEPVLDDFELCFHTNREFLKYVFKKLVTPARLGNRMIFFENEYAQPRVGVL